MRGTPLTTSVRSCFGSKLKGRMSKKNVTEEVLEEGELGDDNPKKILNCNDSSNYAGYSHHWEVSSYDTHRYQVNPQFFPWVLLQTSRFSHWNQFFFKSNCGQWRKTKESRNVSRGHLKCEKFSISSGFLFNWFRGVWHSVRGLMAEDIRAYNMKFWDCGNGFFDG